MASEDSDLMVHDMIGRLFEEPEPTHRADLADGAIAHGMAATRRRGFAVAGTTLSVLGVVAGAVTVAGGSGGGSWSLGTESAKTSPQAYEDASPTYADREREVVQQLPGVLKPLLPAGVTIGPAQSEPIRLTYVPTGDYEPSLMLRSGNVDYSAVFDGTTDPSAYADVFKKVPSAPVAVAGGSIRTAVESAPAADGKAVFSTWYEFTPTDNAEPALRFHIDGESAGTANAIDTAAFKKMVEAPGFAKLRQLLDPSIPASAAAVQQRYAVEAKINAEAKTVLPAGFRLKLDPGAPGGLELVGPGGVNTFQWGNLTGSRNQIACPVEALCFGLDGGRDFRKVGPDGKARLGMYAGWLGKSTDSSVVLSVFGKPQLSPAFPGPPAIGKPVETAPQGPGLTPQQARAIVDAPGLPKVIADVQKLVALNGAAG